MVDYNYISKVVRKLELFFVKENGGRFDGTTYSLILFIPVIRFEGRYKYELILSAKSFDKYSRKEIISNIFMWLNSTLEEDEVKIIESIIVANTNSPFVKNMNFVIPIKEGIRELDNFSVGGVTIHHGILVFSNLLKKMKEGNAIAAKLKDSRIINMGVEKIDENQNIHYYTGKGLRELFAPNRNDEEKKKGEAIKNKGKDYLIENNYYDTINIDEIIEIE